ncbi:MAG: hypothetical protein AAF206_10465 [Bacteroidota bacterium]
MDAASFSKGDSGANVNWNFSGLVSTATDTIKVVDPATLSQTADFPQTNIGFVE